MYFPPAHTCLIATISPVDLSIALYTTPKLPPANALVAVMLTRHVVEGLTAEFLQDLVLGSFVRHSSNSNIEHCNGTRGEVQ